MARKKKEDSAPEKGSKLEPIGDEELWSDEELERRFNNLAVLLAPDDNNDTPAGQKMSEKSDEINPAKYPPHVRKVIERELKELQSGNNLESSKVRRYLDWIKELPWYPEKHSKVNMRIARAMLEERHFGMTEVKEKIMEYLAVQSLTGETYGTVLLLVGPPGVGKTSLAKSIARAMERTFAKISLGGVYDEAVIHGFDRTYSGSQPGNIVRAIRQCGTLSPVMLLDEIDKIGQAAQHGDVAAALLEVLDSDRGAFMDQYLDIPLDLNRVVFIATANDTQTIPPVLLDRMQTVEIDGYSVDEKIVIARKYILPEELKRHGLKHNFINIEDSALDRMIRDYTNEPGVRDLQHHFQNICSRAAYLLVTDKVEESLTIKRAMLPQFLGPAPNNKRLITAQSEVGVANALGYVAQGRGSVCPVEVGILPGDGRIQYTGNLRKILRESCEVAVSILRTRARDWNLDPDFYEKADIHFHALQASVPKEGPSMGVTLFTALFSALSNIPVQGDLAMTGEITLRGRIMPIGGLEEKLSAAYNAGIKNVIIPEANRYDVPEIAEKMVKEMNIMYVADVDQLLGKALVNSRRKQAHQKVVSKSRENDLNAASLGQ